jgi:rhodanese-related sulfurtransferase
MFTPVKAPKPAPRPVSAATAHRRHDAGALLVDVRPQIARHQGSIPDAVLVDTGAIPTCFTEESPDRIAGVDHDREIVVCSVSSRRAIPAAERLARLGYHHVYYLDGGYLAWQAGHGNL